MRPTLMARAPKPEQYLQAIIDNTNLVAYLKRPDGRYVYVNRKYEQIARVPRERIVGRYDRDLFPDQIATLFRTQDLEVIRRKVPVEFDETIKLPDGMLSWITAKFPLLDERGEVWAVGGVCTDITARKRQTDERLAAEREKLAVTLRSIGDAVVSADTEGRVQLLNPAAEALTGWAEDDAVGRPLDQVCRLFRHGDERPYVRPFEEVLGGRERAEPLDGLALEARDGRRTPVAVRGAPLRGRDGRALGGVLTIRDMTGFLRAQEELAHAGRLESLGTLAGGIAHDFNNMLTCVVGNLGLAVDLVDALPEARGLLEDTRRAVQRAAGLTQQLLTFAKGGAPVRAIANVGDLVREAARFASAGGSAAVRVQVADELWPAEVDAGQIVQVVQNLVINARQAMPNGGAVDIQVRNRDGEAGGLPAPLAPGRYLEVVVSDEGCGIPRDVIGRIFDPYFSTKKNGHGLGLAVAFSIVRKHHGHLWAESPDGAGATFTFLLPACSASAAAPAAAAAGPRLSGRVLVMDDDAEVLDSAVRMLGRLGLEAFAVRNGHEAVAAARGALKVGRPFDVFLLDYTVRGGSGAKAALKDLRKVQPGARAVVMSGYADEPCMSAPRAAGFAAAVAKPFGPDQLRAALAPLLEAPRPKARKRPARRRAARA